MSEGRREFIEVVESELTKLGVEFVRTSEVDKGSQERRDFNERFLLALGCYMPSICKDLLRDCQVDIRLFGFEYARQKRLKFIDNSLSGQGDKK